MAKRWAKSKLKAAGKALKEHGRNGDSDVVHVNSREKSMLKRYGGSGSTNPKTGLKEYFGNEGGGAGYSGGGSRNAFSGPGGASGNKSTGGSNKNIPTKATGPTPANDTLGSPESAAAANASLGNAESLGAPSPSAAAPSKNLPTGVTGMDKPAPPGATRYQEGADAIGIGGTIAGAIAGNVGRGLVEGMTGTDPLGEHMGKQTGWSAPMDHGIPSGQGSTQGTKASDGKPAASAPKAPSAPSTPSTPKPPSGGAVGAGGTQTVNPDGTIRYQDTSVAGIRAQKRYGKKTGGTAVPSAA